MHVNLPSGTPRAFPQVKKQARICIVFFVPRDLWNHMIYASTRHISSPEDRITSIKHWTPQISSKMATIDEFVLKNIGLWWRYGISRHCDEWKYIIIGRIFESEIILIPPSLKISKSSSNGSYRNTDEVWWRYGIGRSCDELEYCIQFSVERDRNEYIKDKDHILGNLF